MTGNGTLADALSRVMDGIGRIEKSGTAPSAMGGFRFVPETAVMNALQPLLVAEGIMLSPRGKLVQMDDYDTSSGRQMHLATVELEVWARRGEEELLWFSMPGQGADTADKAVGKALTSAKKQGLLIANSVPTGDDPDAAENEGTTRRARGNAAARAQERSGRAEEVRQRVSHSELQDRVLRLADDHALVPAVLSKIVGDISGGRRFETLDDEELIALGKRIAAGEWDVPFDEPAAGEQGGTEASVSPAMTPPAGPTLDDILQATGGELVDEQPGQGERGASPPGAPAETPAPVSPGAAASAPPSAPNPLDSRIERARARAHSAR